MKVILKGGHWKNTEDEILKSAVMKYGKNQWTRIASLLNRKSPKQCKARWYEWLDPSINKQEWRREEDEKLLHLSKIMPCQWRSIAPLVGRTAVQCLERYQQLLDDAESKLNAEDPSSSTSGQVAPGVTGVQLGESARRLRPGEMDPHMESKPAKPDPIDMNDDELEMLSEARARLANTQGKKAKRKARERQLEEARRLAAVQKRQELKAVGVDFKYKRRRSEFDYNSEIPFYVPPRPGFHDTSDEKTVRGDQSNFVGMDITELEPKTLRQKYDEQRREDEKRQREQKKEDAVFKVPQLKRLHEEQSIAKRRKLDLPQPQLHDSELEELVKIGQSNSSLRSQVDGADPSSSTSSSSLLAEQRPNTLSAHLRPSTSASDTALKTPKPVDTVGNEALNILRQSTSQTPLLGGDNFQLLQGGTGFNGITPQHAHMQTPNPLASIVRDPSGALTPRHAASVSDRASSVGTEVSERGTPIRDSLGINKRSAEDGEWDDLQSRAEEEPEQPEISLETIRKNLELAFKSLPAPKNDYEIVLPELSDDEDEIDATQDGALDNFDAEDIPTVQFEKDMADVEDEALHRISEAEKNRLLQRSIPAQRNLPIPRSLKALEEYMDHVSTDILADGGTPSVSALINDQMRKLIERDIKPTSTHVEPVDLTYLEKANREIQVEFDRSFPDFDVTAIADQLQKLRDAHTGDIFNNVDAMERDLIEKTEKLTRKIETLLRSEQETASALRKKIREKTEELEELQIDLECYKRLKTVEEQAIIPERLEKAQKELRHVQQLEQLEQQRYQQLKSQLTSLKNHK